MIFNSTEVRNVVNVQESIFSGVKAGKSHLKKKEILAVSEGIFQLLKERKFISASSKLKLRTGEGRLGFYLEHSGERGSRLYAECLNQALAEIVYPKYLLRFGIFGKRYCPVPDFFAKDKGMTEAFRTKVKGCRELIQVNTERGKEILLKQRLINVDSEGVRVIKELM